MKKKVWIITAIIIGAAVLGIGIYQSDAVHGDPDLSQEEIREIINTQYPGEITEITLQKDTQSAVYEVLLEYDGNAYTLSVDGNTGEVIEMHEEELPDPQQGEAFEENREVDEQRQEDTDEQAQEDTEKEELTEASDRGGSSVIDTEEAQRIALNEFDGTVTSLELDEEDGRLIYEIEIERDNQEAEIELDALTGEILVISIDIDD